MTDRRALKRGLIIGLITAGLLASFLIDGVPLLMLCWEWAYRSTGN